MINPQNLLSDDERMKLQAWGQEIDAPCWNIGYFVVERMKEIEAEEVKIPKMLLYKEVGKEVGKSAETVRGYYYVCSHVPRNIYFTWGEIFSFSQFRRLVPICGTDHNEYVRKCEEFTVYCGEYSTNLTSVDALTAWLNKDKNKEPQERKWYDKLQLYCEKLEASANVPTVVRQAIMRFSVKLALLVKDEWE